MYYESSQSDTPEWGIGKIICRQQSTKREDMPIRQEFARFSLATCVSRPETLAFDNARFRPTSTISQQDTLSWRYQRMKSFELLSSVQVRSATIIMYPQSAWTHAPSSSPSATRIRVCLINVARIGVLMT